MASLLDDGPHVNPRGLKRLLQETMDKEERDRIHLPALQSSVFHYQHKVREALSPNDLADAYYETLDAAP